MCVPNVYPPQLGVISVNETLEFRYISLYIIDQSDDIVIFAMTLGDVFPDRGDDGLPYWDKLQKDIYL